MVQCMSQIYKVEDLQRLMGREAGREFYKKYTKNEVVLALGKGSVRTIPQPLVVHTWFTSSCA